MARPRPHFRTHLSIRNHRKTSGLYADKELLGIWVSLGVEAIAAYAAKTNDTFYLNWRQVSTITGRSGRSYSEKALRRLEEVAPPSFRFSEEGVEVYFPNLAKKHGMGAINGTQTDTVNVQRKKKEERREKREHCARPASDVNRSLPLISSLRQPEAQPPVFDDERRAWLEDQIPVIDASVEAQKGTFRELTIRYFKHYLKGDRAFLGIAQRESNRAKVIEIQNRPDPEPTEPLDEEMIR